MTPSFRSILCRVMKINYIENCSHIFITYYYQQHFIVEDLFPINPTNEDLQRKKRFCGYRIMIYWLYPELKRKQRRPLPACLYSYIQARFPPVDNEELFADWRFSEYADNWPYYLLIIFKYLNIFYYTIKNIEPYYIISIYFLFFLLDPSISSSDSGIIWIFLFNPLLECRSLISSLSICSPRLANVGIEPSLRTISFFFWVTSSSSRVKSLCL